MWPSAPPSRRRDASLLRVWAVMPRSDGDALSQGGHDCGPAQAVVEPVPQGGGLFGAGTRPAPAVWALLSAAGGELHKVKLPVRRCPCSTRAADPGWLARVSGLS